MSDYKALAFLLNLWNLEVSFSTPQLNFLCTSLRRETHSSGVYTVFLRFLTFFPMRSRYTMETFFGRSEVTYVNYLRLFWVMTGQYCAVLLLAPALVEVSAFGVSYVTLFIKCWTRLKSRGGRSLLCKSKSTTWGTPKFFVSVKGRWMAHFPLSPILWFTLWAPSNCCVTPSSFLVSESWRCLQN